MTVGDHEPAAEHASLDRDALDHFWSAAHELITAMRTLLDAADEFVEHQRQPRAGVEPRVRHIDIDEH